jgi:hypothetical protein
MEYSGSVDRLFGLAQVTLCTFISIAAYRTNRIAIQAPKHVTWIFLFSFLVARGVGGMSPSHLHLAHCSHLTPCYSI